jgi:hypothetical protein
MGVTLPTIYRRMVMIPAAQIGVQRFLPADVGTPISSSPVRDPNPTEHPAGMSTPTGRQLRPMAPRNNSNLAIEYPLESSLESPAA